MAHVRRPPRWPWLLVLIVLSGAAFFGVTRDPWPAEQGVLQPEDEPAQTARVVALAVAAVNRARSDAGAQAPFARLLGAKAHGCVRAQLSVPELEPGLRHGLFARAGEYKAWIRFSSAFPRSRSDQEADARSVAIKVMGVPGAKLLESERDAPTQDFLLVDSSRLFLSSVAELAELLDAASHGRTLSFFLDGGPWRPWRWRLREAWLAARTRRPPPASLLQTQYHSLTAYRLGPQQLVKYSLRPCEWKRPPRQDRTDDMLRRGLREELATAESCFELLAQLQVPGRNMPVEDPTVRWSERDSPFRTLARVRIPVQAFDTPEQDRFCEDLSFTPWHSLPEHEPVGGLNRVGKVVYQELSRYRHDRNQTAAGEPAGFCLDLTRASCPVEEGGPPPAPPEVFTRQAPPPSPARPPAATPVPGPPPEPAVEPTPVPEPPPPTAGR